MNFRIAVKAFIVKDHKLLLIKRRSNDVHKPGAWDIPGGRLELGEDPYLGISREALEEVGLELQILLPFDVHHFVRDDGQQITMLIFLCKPKTDQLKLSEEHQEYLWQDLAAAKSEFPEWLYPVVEKYFKFKLNQF